MKWLVFRTVAMTGDGWTEKVAVEDLLPYLRPELAGRSDTRDAWRLPHIQDYAVVDGDQIEDAFAAFAEVMQEPQRTTRLHAVPLGAIQVLDVDVEHHPPTVTTHRVV